MVKLLAKYTKYFYVHAERFMLKALLLTARIESFDIPELEVVMNLGQFLLLKGIYIPRLEYESQRQTGPEISRRY